MPAARGAPAPISSNATPRRRRLPRKASPARRDAPRARRGHAPRAARRGPARRSAPRPPCPRAGHPPAGRPGSGAAARWPAANQRADSDGAVHLVARDHEEVRRIECERQPGEGLDRVTKQHDARVAAASQLCPALNGLDDAVSLLTCMSAASRAGSDRASAASSRSTWPERLARTQRTAASPSASRAFRHRRTESCSSVLATTRRGRCSPTSARSVPARRGCWPPSPSR